MKKSQLPGDGQTERVQTENRPPIDLSMMAAAPPPSMFTATTFLLNLPPLTSVFITYCVPHNIPFIHNSKQENNNGICITASVRKHHITSHHITSHHQTSLSAKRTPFKNSNSEQLKRKRSFLKHPESISKLIDINTNINKTVSNTSTGTGIISLSSQTFWKTEASIITTTFRKTRLKRTLMIGFPYTYHSNTKISNYNI